MAQGLISIRQIEKIIVATAAVGMGVLGFSSIQPSEIFLGHVFEFPTSEIEARQGLVRGKGPRWNGRGTLASISKEPAEIPKFHAGGRRSVEVKNRVTFEILMEMVRIVPVDASEKGAVVIESTQFVDEELVDLFGIKGQGVMPEKTAGKVEVEVEGGV